MHRWLASKNIQGTINTHSTKKPVTTMLTYPWKCTVLHCNHLGNTWKPLVLMTQHFDYCPSTSEGNNQSVRSSAPVVSRCFPDGYNVKLYISRGRLAWWLLAFLQWHTLALYSSKLHRRLLEADTNHDTKCKAHNAAWWKGSINVAKPASCSVYAIILRIITIKIEGEKVYSLFYFLIYFSGYSLERLCKYSIT